jgi:rhodanese-related sulfurtransferase
MNRTMTVLLLVLVSVCSYAQPQDASKPAGDVPKEKQTSLGLYLTALEAYEKWKADPKQVKILDVRIPEEYVFVGHPAMAWNVSVMLQTYQWDASGRKLPTKPNPDFEARAKEFFKPSHTRLVMCRSGGRSDSTRGGSTVRRPI